MGKFDRLKSISVLYVEDSKFLSKTMTRVIDKIFYKVYVAHNGHEGLEMLEKHKDEIDLIITDLIMPFMDGIEMVEKIRANENEIPIIITTGSADIMEKEKLIDLMIDGFLSKPVDMFKLLKRVNKIVENLFIKRELIAKKEMIENDVIYFEIDTNGMFTYVSKPFEKISGYKKDEVVGKLISILYDMDKSQDIYDEIWGKLELTKHWSGEVEYKKKGGGHYMLESLISPRYFRKRLVGYNSTNIDVTELHAKSQELSIKSRQAAMGEMIAMIAHQWRQPITSIGMISNNLLFDLTMDELENDELSRSLNSINGHVEYLSKTIDVFRNFLQESKKKERFLLEDAINESILAVQEQFKSKEIALSFENRCKNIILYTFKNELIQSIMNILANAKDALEELGNKEFLKTVILCEENSEAVFIKVSDNAGGIKEELLSKIFEPYFSTKKAKNGTGLGLYMTKTIVQDNLGGKLSVKNIQDGAEFTIELSKKGCSDGKRDNS